MLPGQGNFQAKVPILGPFCTNTFVNTSKLQKNNADNVYFFMQSVAVFRVLWYNNSGKGDIMNYSKTIREYCQKNPGMVFDMSYERERHFPMVPYRTFCKILSRIEAEGIIRTYSKGIYNKLG